MAISQLTYLGKASNTVSFAVNSQDRDYQLQMGVLLEFIDGGLTPQLITDLANESDPAKGASMVGFYRPTLPGSSGTVTRALSGQIVSIWEFVGFITNKPVSDNPETWDWTPAFQAAVNSVYPAVIVPGILYNLSSVDITKSMAFLCNTGTTFKRMPGLDISQSTWNKGTGMFEINVHGLSVAFVGGPTFDGNQENQPAIEPNGYSLKINPPTMTSTQNTRVFMDRPVFKNGTAGYLMLRGADAGRKFRTVVQLMSPVFTDTRTGKGKGDPSTPTALGWSPTYVWALDYVELSSHNTDMSFSRATVLGEYAPVGLLGTYYGQTPANTGECIVSMTGKTRLERIGRKSINYNGTSYDNNGIGAIDLYGNGESLYIEDVYAKNCEAVSTRAKSSIKRYTIVNLYAEGCDAAINVSPSSTGLPEAVVEIGNAVIINCGTPSINIAGNSPSSLIASLNIDRAYITGNYDSGNVASSANGAIHVRYVNNANINVAEIASSAFRGITSVENVDFSIGRLFINTCALEGLLLNATVNSNNIGFVKIANAGGAGVSMTGTTKITRVQSGDIDTCLNYGIFANLGVGAGILQVRNVYTANITGTSRGIYFNNVTGRAESCTAGSGVTTPLFKTTTARVSEFGNSWIPATFYGIAAPTDGTYQRGDIVYNTITAPSGTVGWVCTTAGSPGTWKTFGAISA